MPSTRKAGAAQRGASLIEAVVASALMGIGVVGGLTAWDTAAMSASRAVRIAWANCIVHAELNAILSAPYDETNYPVPPEFTGDHTVRVAVSPSRGAPDSPGEEQVVTVQAVDPRSGSTVLAQVSALKTRALAGGKDLNGGVLSDAMLGCPQR
jgi:hypothetical protein